MKHMKIAAVIVCGGVASASVASGAPYPSKPIRMLVPFAPGSGADLIARIVAPRLSERFGQSIIVDNRPAAGGIVAAEMAAGGLNA